MRVISYNFQSFRSKIYPVKSLLNRCEKLLLHETLLLKSGLGVLDDLDDKFVTAYIPTIRKHNSFVG